MMDVLKACIRVQKQAYYRRVNHRQQAQIMFPGRPQDMEAGPVWPEDGRNPYLM